MIKKNKRIIGIIFIIVIAILIFKVGFRPKGLTVGEIPSGCNVVGSGTTDNVFTCTSQCDVNGFDTCTSQTGEQQIVVFRTNAKSSNDYENAETWIAINGVPSGKSLTETSNLIGYCPTGSHGNIVGGVLSMDTPHNNDIRIYNSRIYIVIGSDMFRYDVCDSADLSLTPKEPYTSNNQEIYSGTTNAYLCEKEWKITKSGQTINSGIATYSGGSSGDYETGVKRLNRNEVFEFSGRISYAIIDATQSCIIDTCNIENTGYYKCIEDNNGCKVKSNSLTLCSEGEFCIQKPSGAECSIPFDIFYEFQDANENTKTGFGIDEDIYFDLLTNSQTINNAILDISLLDSQNNVIVTKTRTITYPNTQSLILDFPSQSDTGLYKIRLDISFEDKQVSREYEFRVANPISLSIRAFSEGAGTTLFTNEPSIVEFRVFDDAGNPTSANTNLILDINGKTIQSPIPITKTLGVYQYIVVVQEDGILNAIGSAEKLGFTKTQTAEFIVKPADIRIEFLNIGLLQDIKLGAYTIEFETRNPQGDLINTQNSVEVILPAGTKQSLTSIQGSNGKYSFVYNFNTEGGYKIKIRSETIGYTPKEVESPFINVIKEGGDILECDSSDDCGLGKICVNNKCTDESPGSSILVYLLIGGSILLVVVIVILIIKLKKRK